MSYVHIFDVSTGIALVFAFIGISRAFIASVVFSRIGPAVARQREAGRRFFWTGCTGLTGWEGCEFRLEGGVNAEAWRGRAAAKRGMPAAGNGGFFLPRISRMGLPDKATTMGTCRSAPGHCRLDGAIPLPSSNWVTPLSRSARLCGVGCQSGDWRSRATDPPFSPFTPSGGWFLLATGYP